MQEQPQARAAQATQLLAGAQVHGSGFPASARHRVQRLVESDTRRRRAGQSDLLLIIMVIMVALGLAVFLLNIARTVSQPAYLNLYAHNLLVGMLRADTGSLDLNCRALSDAAACAFFTPAWSCYDTGETCSALTDRIVRRDMGEFALIKKSYDYLLTIAPETGSVLGDDGKPFYIQIGKKKLAGVKTDKVVATERLYRTTASGQQTLKAQLILVKKP